MDFDGDDGSILIPKDAGEESHTEDPITKFTWVRDSGGETYEVGEAVDDLKHPQGTMEEVVSAKDKKARR